MEHLDQVERWIHRDLLLKAFPESTNLGAMLLGTIVTGEPTANCAFGDDGQTLYMTANDKLTRIRLRTRGAVGK